MPYAVPRNPDGSLATDRIVRESDGATIPRDPANADYAAFLASGEHAADAPAPVAEGYYVPVPLARQRLEAAGKWDDLAAALIANPAAMLKVLTLEEGIAPDDEEAVGLLTMIGADPAVILAPVGA